MTVQATFPGVAPPTNNDSPGHISWSCSTYKQWLSTPHFLELLHLQTMTLQATFPGVAPPTNNDSPHHISWSCSLPHISTRPRYQHVSYLASIRHEILMSKTFLQSIVLCFYNSCSAWRGITNSSSCINVSYKTSIITQWLETCRFSRGLAHFHHTQNNSSENMCKHAQLVVNLYEFTWFSVMQ